MVGSSNKEESALTFAGSLPNFLSSGLLDLRGHEINRHKKRSDNDIEFNLI